MGPLLHGELHPAGAGQEAPVELGIGGQARDTLERLLELEVLVVAGEEGGQRRLALLEERLERTAPTLTQRSRLRLAQV
ncbi:hypothetical protein ACN28S_37380 [Cystobacter fuscus]